MSNYPYLAETKSRKYKINTDFRVALECNKVSKSNISEEERALAIIYLLFGEEGLKNSNDWDELIKIAIKYLQCNKETVSKKDSDEEDMSYEQDIGYIETSFFYDYRIDLKDAKMHWWEFYEKLCGLSEKCILSRVRYIRSFDISTLKDKKLKEKWIEQKKLVALKKKKRSKTDKEKELDELFRTQINPQRK